MATPETSREPCPDRIIDDVGGAFGMGAIGGGAYHFIRGLYNSPKGERITGGAQTVRMNAPRVGGSFAVWGGLFSVFDCSFVYLRQKEDPWNSVFAGAATGGFLSMRQGPGAVGRSAAFGAILLGLIEGAGLVINRYAPGNAPPQIIDDPSLMHGPPPGYSPIPAGYLPQGAMMREEEAPSGPSAWFGGLFGKKAEEKSSGGGSKTEVLESFDSPSPPIPSFEYK